MMTLHRVRYTGADYLSGRRDGRRYPADVRYAWTYHICGRESREYFSTRLQAARAAYPLFSGGQAMEYTDGSTIICGECAAHDAVNGDAAGLWGGPVEEADRDIICEGCGRLILTQNLCPEHGYQPDAIMDRDEPFAYRCPICDGDDPAFVRHCDICGETLHPGNVSRDDHAVCQSCHDAL